MLCVSHVPSLLMFKIFIRPEHHVVNEGSVNTSRCLTQHFQSYSVKWCGQYFLFIRHKSKKENSSLSFLKSLLENFSSKSSLMFSALPWRSMKLSRGKKRTNRRLHEKLMFLADILHIKGEVQTLHQMPLFEIVFI